MKNYFKRGFILLTAVLFVAGAIFVFAKNVKAETIVGDPSNFQGTEVSHVGSYPYQYAVNYTLWAYTTAGDGTVVYSQNPATVSVGATDGSMDVFQPQLSWDAVANADGYVLESMTQQTPSVAPVYNYINLGNILSYTDDGTNSGWTTYNQFVPVQTSPYISQAEADQSAAQTVINQISALPATASLALINATAVTASETAYAALTSAQQALVTNYSTLTADEAQIAVLQTPAPTPAPIPAPSPVPAPVPVLAPVVAVGNSGGASLLASLLSVPKAVAPAITPVAVVSATTATLTARNVVSPKTPKASEDIVVTEAAQQNPQLQVETNNKLPVNLQQASLASAVSSKNIAIFVVILLIIIIIMSVWYFVGKKKTK